MASKAFVLRKWASEQGLHPSDLLVEVNYVSGVAASTGTIPTSFANGDVIAVIATFNVLTTMTTTIKIPLTVTSGALTWTTSANLLMTDRFSVIVIARTQV